LGDSRSARSWQSKRARKRRLIRTVQVGEQPDRAGEGGLQVGAQLVGQRDPVADEVLAGPAGRPQHHRRGRVRGQRAQPGPIGAQRVGEHVGVEAVVLVAGRAVAAAQVLQLVRADHDHGQRGLEQRRHHRAVGPLDGDLAHAELAQPAQQGAQAGVGVLDGEPFDLAPGAVDDADRVVVAGPVDPARQPVGRCRRQGGWGRLHHSLLAASPVGRHPHVRCRDAAAGSLTVRRSVALSPVDGRRVPGDHRISQNSRWTSKRQASRAMTRWHLGCIGDPSEVTDRKRVHQ
jgi:hypothetical protein